MEYNLAMNKHEAKSFNTARKAQKAMLELLEEKEYEDITISDICKKAGINRSTFYAHYENIMDLVSELEKTIIDDFIVTFDSANREQDKTESGLYMLISTATLTSYLDYVRKYRKLFMIYNKSNAFSHDEHYNILKDRIFLPALKDKGIEDSIAMEYMFEYYLTGVNAIIRKWVNDDCNIPTDKLCEIIRRCVIKKL